MMKWFLVVAAGMAGLCLGGCAETKSASPPSPILKKATATVKTNIAGRTVEQQNLVDRLKEDNRIGAIQHLYVISAYSGQVLMYSTVRGKVSSSHKRLSPRTIAAMDGQYVDSEFYGIPVLAEGRQRRTGEVLGDDGTYGDSSEYIFWWDTKGIYHQHYVVGGQILHISSEPIAVKSVVINLSR